MLLHRRPGDAEWLAGRWHLPTVELGRGDESVSDAAALLGEAFGGDWHCEDGAVVRHAITYRDFVVRVAVADWRPDPGLEEPLPGSARRELGWFAPEEVDGLPTSSLLRKSLASIPIHSAP